MVCDDCSVLWCLLVVLSLNCFMQDLVMAKVDMTDVPGMSPLGVEGLDDQAVANVSTLISLLTVS